MTQSMDNHTRRECLPGQVWAIYAKLVAVAVIWGGTFVAGRHLAGAGSPLVLASIRFILASVALAGYLFITRTPLARPDTKQCLQLMLLGFFGIFTYNVFFFYGLNHTTASRAALIVALNPACIALAAYCFFKEPLWGARIMGILLCLTGASTVILSRTAVNAGDGSLTGDVLILGCVASWVIYSVFSRSLSRSLGPMLTATYSIWFGTIMLCLLAVVAVDSAALMPHLSPAHWGSLIFLGCLGSALAYIWYYDAILKIGPTRSGAFIALNPLTAVLFGVLLFGETLAPQACAGGALAIAGIYLCNRPQP